MGVALIISLRGVVALVSALMRTWSRARGLVLRAVTARIEKEDRNIGGSSNQQVADDCSLDRLTKNLCFGPAAFGTLAAVPVNAGSAEDETNNEDEDQHDELNLDVAELVEGSVAGVTTMMGQRGERFVTEMLTAWTQVGLFMHGSPSSPLNRLIIPATRHIFAIMASLPPKHPKRVDCLSTLAYACQDCQQVQAREILRIYSDLTSQRASLEGQLKYSLIREKEATLNGYISRKHPKCDLDHTQVAPWQQRVHLFSGYVSLVGQEFGMDSLTAAQSDRFASSALQEIGELDAATLLADLRGDMSVKDWLLMLLADINNQAEDADRLIDRDCIFRWAQENMSSEAAYLVFYDDDRAGEFAMQQPMKPEPGNCYQPFLSVKVLVEILKKACFLAAE